MRITVPVIVEIADDMIASYAEEFDLMHNGKPSARAIEKHVREWAVSDIVRGPLGEVAEVSLRGER